jgi:hypothetical protein
LEVIEHGTLNLQTWRVIIKLGQCKSRQTFGVSSRIWGTLTHNFGFLFSKVTPHLSLWVCLYVTLTSRGQLDWSWAMNLKCWHHPWLSKESIQWMIRSTISKLWLDSRMGVVALGSPLTLGVASLTCVNLQAH